MNNQSNTSWNFERPFHFESDGSLEQVVRSLAQLEEEGGFFSSSHNDISIVPDRGGYSFRYRIRRQGKNITYTTAVGAGQVWQEENGPVIVEGQSQINSEGFYGSLALCIFFAVMVVLFTHGLFGFFPLIMLGGGGFMVLLYYADRNLVVDRIGEAVANTHNDMFRRDKDKRAATSGKVKNMRLNVNETVNPNSVWNEAISEYEDDQTYK